MKKAELCEVRIDQAILADPASVDEIADAISACLREADTETVRRFLKEHQSADNASFLERLEPEEAMAALRLVVAAHQATIFGYLAPRHQVALANAMPRSNSRRLSRPCLMTNAPTCTKG